jgi:hypothetical protein
MTRRHSLAWYSQFAIILAIAALFCATAVAQNRGRDVEVYRWTGNGFAAVPGAAGVRIAVGPNGALWIVRANGQILRQMRDGFRRLPGTASDIAVGGDGSVWIIGQDNAVYRWTGRMWDPYMIPGVAISADEDGDPWIVNSSGQIARWDGETERLLSIPGTARDIGAESSVWVIGRDGGVREMQSNGRLSAVRGSGVRVSAGVNGQAWVVNEAGEIYRWTGGGFERIPGSAVDVASNARGDVYVVGMPVEQERRAVPRRR